MFDEDPFANLFFNDMPVQLECTVPECDYGDGGAKWTNPALSEDIALKLLEIDEAIAHDQQDDGPAAGGGAGGRSRLAKIARPSVSGGCCHEEFKFFTSEWERYVRSSLGVENTELRDQLFSCPDEILRTAFNRSLGARLSTISVADLLTEIKRLAVVSREGQKIEK